MARLGSARFVTMKPTRGNTSPTWRSLSPRLVGPWVRCLPASGNDCSGRVACGWAVPVLRRYARYLAAALRRGSRRADVRPGKPARILSSELSPRTFWNFAGDFSSFRRQRAPSGSGADLAHGSAVYSGILEFCGRVLVIQAPRGCYGRAALISDTVLPVYSPSVQEPCYC
jgi:hypothetical protein